MVEVVANLHMHTPYSDGTRYHDEIAQAAKAASVQVVCVTDHNIYVREVEGYKHGVLVLVGQEVHDPQRNPQRSHCLVYNTNDELSPLAANPQKLVDETNARGGMAFFAHPVEYAPKVGPERETYAWDDWHVRRNTGIEIWNAMTDFKARLTNVPFMLWFALFPSWALMGPFKAMLRKWDELLAGGERVVGIGNSDAHGTRFYLGKIMREVIAYDYLFRCVNTHVFIDKPLTRDVATDKKMVYAALRAGHCFVGYDLIAPTRGFTFKAKTGSGRFVTRPNSLRLNAGRAPITQSNAKTDPSEVTMGDELSQHGAVQFEVCCPSPAQIKLVCAGKTVAQTFGTRLTFTTDKKGAYRVECYRPFRLRNRGWIFSNPIYVR